MWKNSLFSGTVCPLLPPRRTRRTLLPLTSALMMRYIEKGQEGALPPSNQTLSL